MSVVSKEEIDKLSLMYDGDKSRDASDKIRGFLFQDYIAIGCLLDNDVEYVCSEYIEDVDVFFQDGRLLIIQAKYYPNTVPKKDEIFTDLFYQYLQLRMLNSNMSAIPSLYIHRAVTVAIPTIDEMKTYVVGENALRKKVIYPNEVDAEKFLEEEVYSLTKKEERKRKLFLKMASEESIKGFLDACSIVHLSNIDKYKDEVMDKLALSYPRPDRSVDQGNWKLILLGLAISRIQSRYMLKDPSFEQLRVNKNDFDQHMRMTVQTRDELSIVYYLIGVTYEIYGQIIIGNDLSVVQRKMLDQIYYNTVNWLTMTLDNPDGQYRLLNTISTDDCSKIKDFMDMPIDARLIKIAECKPGFECFICYLWKIMLDINQSNGMTNSVDNDDELDPSSYVDNSVKDYICLHFPEDKLISHAVILPEVLSRFNTIRRNIVSRMINAEPKPGKWFFGNNGIMRGKNYYKYSTADVCDNPTVADLGQEIFYIECMDCIGVDEGQWNKNERCDTCIFSEQCVRGE
ncbi:hypothetical protein SAMN04487928_1445 [Butyrivibrio proteoclasticus]|uniref:Uncharacterized protein n=1 Tax=Butyrivibrio proteoclasticus TaxID=43305 RepID=A0A1I5YCX2_9FIRM|nr:hypothetical protein [Butyrivibrio proteoclasticus]SFQ42085.1 hypothetical protein SAMN04487928_1445 [Butyrivibrio proteoclasticus]